MGNEWMDTCIAKGRVNFTRAFESHSSTLHDHAKVPISVILIHILQNIGAQKTQQRGEQKSQFHWSSTKL